MQPVALDESQEPAAIASSVLRRIAEPPNGRPVVRTRKSTREGPDQPEPADEDILQALGADTVVVEVDRDADAIATYVRRRLTASLTVDAAAVNRAVELISLQRRQFLFARLAVHEILARPALLGASAAAALGLPLR